MPPTHRTPLTVFKSMNDDFSEKSYSTATTDDGTTLIIELKEDGISWSVVGTISQDLSEKLISAMNYRADVEHSHCDRMIQEWVNKTKTWFSMAATMADIIKQTSPETDESVRCLDKFTELYNESIV